jgi:hypothetical protein
MRTLIERPSIFIRDNPILSSERMLRKGYGCKGTVAEKYVVVSLKLFDAENWLTVTLQS